MAKAPKLTPFPEEAKPIWAQFCAGYELGTFVARKFMETLHPGNTVLADLLKDMERLRPNPEPWSEAARAIISPPRVLSTKDIIPRDPVTGEIDYPDEREDRP